MKCWSSFIQTTWSTLLAGTKKELPFRSMTCQCLSNQSFPSEYVNAVDCVNHELAIVLLPLANTLQKSYEPVLFVLLNPVSLIICFAARFFSQTKYASFQRQLNLYGFSRKRHGKSSAYYHSFFIRGLPDLVRNMVRCKVKGTGKKRMEGEPYSPSSVATRAIHQSSESCNPEDSSQDESSDEDDVFSHEGTSAREGDLLFFEGSPFHFLEPSRFDSPTSVATAMPIPNLSSSDESMTKSRLVPRSSQNMSELYDFVL